MLEIAINFYARLAAHWSGKQEAALATLESGIGITRRDAKSPDNAKYNVNYSKGSWKYEYYAMDVIYIAVSAPWKMEMELFVPWLG